MTLKTIRLELARCAEFPEGSSELGYDIVAPLTANGHIDLEAWKSAKAKCTVRRFARAADDENGMLVHRRGGWLFDYDPDAADDDEPVFKLDRHVFRQGEYVTVTEHDGEQRTYQIAAVR